VSRRVVAIILLVAAVAVLAVLGVMQAPPPVSPDELARRIAESRPTWANYDEDVKAQIGATPTAQWRGSPDAAQRDGATVRVTFRLSGPWAQQRQVAFPILLREPLGGIHRPARADCGDGRATYVFQLDDEAATGVLPWLEVKYPYGEKRLVLSEDGSWRASP